MENNRIAFVFPGQGSQQLGMGFELSQVYSVARDIYKHADEILGFPISSLSWNGPEEAINDTINTQPALFAHSIAALRVLQTQTADIQPLAVAGHSMGELSALTAVGSLSFEDGLRLAQARGELMKQAGDHFPGGMAAVLGLSIPDIERLCAQCSAGNDIVQVANDNCPGQVVVSGTNEALDRVIPLLQNEGARRVIKLAVSIAAHSPLMVQAQDAFSEVVEITPISTPTLPIIGNVYAKPLESIQAIRHDLRAQLTHRVRWTETIILLKSMGISLYVEVGNGAVLSGLIKRIDPLATVFQAGTPRELEKLMSIG